MMAMRTNKPAKYEYLLSKYILRNDKKYTMLVQCWASIQRRWPNIEPALSHHYKLVNTMSGKIIVIAQGRNFYGK